MECVVAKKVTVNESVTGSIFITSKGKILKHKEIFPVKKEIVKSKQVKAKKEIISLGRVNQPVKMPIDYSWRRTMDRLFDKEKIAA